MRSLFLFIHSNIAFVPSFALPSSSDVIKSTIENMGEVSLLTFKAAKQKAATADFISTDPRPKISLFIILPEKGSIFHLLISPGFTTSMCPQKPNVGKFLEPHLKKRFLIPFLLTSVILKSVSLNNSLINLNVPASSGVTDGHFTSSEVRLTEFIIIFSSY